MGSLEVYSNQLERAILKLDRSGAEQVFLEAVHEGSAIEIVGELVSVTLNNIGNAWEQGKLSLSQVYMSGVICEEMIDKLLPSNAFPQKSQSRIAIAVFEDYHLLGKRIIVSALRASGFELLDLGGGMQIDQLVDIVKQEKIRILLLSVLMLPSALHIKTLKKRLEGSDVRIVVGGAPFRFDETLWKEVGADAYGKDSAQAIQIVTQMTEGLL